MLDGLAQVIPPVAGSEHDERRSDVVLRHRPACGVGLSRAHRQGGAVRIDRPVLALRLVFHRQARESIPEVVLLDSPLCGMRFLAPHGEGSTVGSDGPA